MTVRFFVFDREPYQNGDHYPFIIEDREAYRAKISNVTHLRLIKRKTVRTRYGMGVVRYGRGTVWAWYGMGTVRYGHGTVWTRYGMDTVRYGHGDKFERIYKQLRVSVREIVCAYVVIFIIKRALI